MSFALGKGKTLVVMGGSGSGKTVLLRIVAGLIRPDAGQVSLFGTRIERLREEAMLPLRRRTGFVFQGAALFDSLSVFENVAYPLREHTRMSLGEITDRVLRFLSLVGLPGHRRALARRAVRRHAQARRDRARARDRAGDASSSTSRRPASIRPTPGWSPS